MAHRISYISSFFKRNLEFMNKRKSMYPPLACRMVSTKSVLQRVVKSIQNDPFVKVSLSLCALIIGGSLVVELYKKVKRSTTPMVAILPPTFAHHSVKRESLLRCIHHKLQKLRSNKEMPTVLYVTGPPGCGKTELVHQFCTYYASVSRKWFGLKAAPYTVISVDATSPQLLCFSLSEVAINLGVPQNSNIEELFSAILSKVTSSHLPWLLVVDNLTKHTNSCFQRLITNYLSRPTPHGAVLVTTRESIKLDDCHSLPIPRLHLEQSFELLDTVSGLHSSSKEPLVLELLEILQYNPMTIVLAAATIKVYSSLFPASQQSTLSMYKELLVQSLTSDSDTLQRSLDLYFEASTSDSRLRHTFDFLGSCDLDYPLPVAVLPVHLNLGLYGIPDEALAPPPLDPILSKLKAMPSKDSRWDRVKSAIPFFQHKALSDDDIANALVASQDEISCIRESPILSFKHSGHANIEFVTVHSVAAQRLSELFAETTSVKLDQDYISKEAMEFEQKAWFRKFRAFDEEKSLRKFQRMLPGLSSPGVLTKAQFDATPVINAEVYHGTGTKVPHKLHYTKYLHIISHYHRVLSSLTSIMRSAKGEMDSILLKKCLVPHFQAIKTFSLISQADRLSAEISLVVINAGCSSPENRRSHIAEYENLIVKQKALLGVKSVLVAHSLVDLADLYLSLNDASSAKELLLSALQIYNLVPSRLNTQDESALELAHALSSLGMACGQLGEKRQSKNFYEQALAASQSVPASGRVTKKQQRLVASLLVDVTHAHLCLGELVLAKKYCELASMMLQTVYPQGHAEMVRLLNISSIVSALLGDREGSTRYQTEASKLKEKLN